MDGWTNGRLTDNHTDKQTDNHTYIQTDKVSRMSYNAYYSFVLY